MNNSLSKYETNHFPQDPATTTPSKVQSKKDKKGGKKGKKGEEVNGDGEHDRTSPEVNSQEQMAAQRASGGEIMAPEVSSAHEWGCLLTIGSVAFMGLCLFQNFSLG